MTITIPVWLMWAIGVPFGIVAIFLMLLGIMVIMYSGR
jgi:hypothetical protein